MKIFGTKKFYIAATIASASLLNISPVQSTEKCSVAEDGSCQALNNLDVVKRSVVGPPIPIQDILFGLFSPSKISNQFTDVILFQTIIAVGWIVAGTIYQLTLALNLSPETRSSVEQLGFWFAPNKYPSSMGINLRNTMFGFFLGRVMFNYITDPTGTMEELNSITWTELRDRMLSNNYLATWLGRFVFQFFLVVTGITVLFAIGNAEGTLYSRNFETSSPLDDLNNSVQASLLKNYI